MQIRSNQNRKRFYSSSSSNALYGPQRYRTRAKPSSDEGRRGIGDERSGGIEDERSRGIEDERSKGIEDERSRGIGDERSRGIEDEGV